MKCDAKNCNNEECKDFIALGESKIHRECMTDDMWLRKTGELFVSKINPTESWPIMMRSLKNWNKQHSAKYICFAMSKAIRNNATLNTFHSFYYILNNANYKKAYENYTTPTENLVFENVYLSKVDYHELLKYMNDNNTMVEYYIKKLSDYIAKTGKEYTNHFETIKQWRDRDNDRKIIKYTDDIL